MRSLPLALAPVLLAGCATRAAPPRATEAALVSVAPVAAARPLEVIEPAAPAPAPPPAPAPVDETVPAPLGAPCGPATSSCGTSGRVAVLWRREQNLGTIPSDACTLVDISRSAARPHVAEACAGRGLVVIHVTCPACPTPEDSDLVGVIAWMTPAQLAHAQSVAGLPAAPLLTTEHAWQAAIARIAPGPRP